MRTLRRSVDFALSLLLVTGLCAPAYSYRPASPVDEGDEQYLFIAGLVEKGHHDLAVKEALTFLQEFPRHPKASLARYRLASSLYDLDRLGEAVGEYRKLASRRGFQFEAEVGFRLGQCELHEGRADRAAAAFARVLELDKDYLHLPATFFLGEAFFRQGDFERAERRYLDVVKDGGGGEYARDAAYGLAWCAFRRGDNDQSVRRIDNFLRAHPRDDAAPELRFLLGEAHLAAGRRTEAIEAYRGVKTGEFVESAMRGVGFALAEGGDHARAAQAFQATLRRFPSGRHAQEVALHLGVEWLRSGEPARALKALSAGGVGRSPEALYWRARAEMETGDAAAALASVDAALETRDLDGELRDQLFVTRGDALSDLGRGEEAVRSYGRSDSEYAMYAASVEALNKGQVDEAVRLAGSLIQAHPETEYRAELQLILGEGLLAEGRHQQAERAFLAALEADEGGELGARVLSRAGWCRFLGENFAGAAELFGRVVREHESAPEAREALYMLGRSQESAGDGARALKSLRAYVDRYPDGERRGEALMGLARLDTEGGARWLEQTLKEGGDGQRSGFALFELAERDMEAGRTAEALQRYEQLVQRYPDDPNVPSALYGSGWCSYQSGDYAAATGPLERLVGTEGVDAELRTAASELLVWAWSKVGDAGRTNVAFQSFARACEDDARLWAAAQVAVAALSADGRREDVKALFDGLLARVRDAEVALEVLVEASWQALDAGQIDEAEAGVLTAIKVASRRKLSGGPRLAEACFFVGEARFDEGDHEKAAALFGQAAERGTDGLVAQALYMQGFAHLRREDWAAAGVSFGGLVAGHAEHDLYGEGLYLLGETHFRAGRYKEAAEALARLTRELPKHEAVDKALFRLGVARGQLEQWKEAEAALTELARRAPKFEHGAEADLWRGRALAARGETRGARAAFERVIAKDSGVLAARGRIGLGRLALSGGDAEGALSEFLKVALLYANEEEVAEALYLAGNCLEELGDPDRAREQYRELLDTYGETSFARAARARIRELGNG
jgi:TolA-binding protein